MSYFEAMLEINGLGEILHADIYASQMFMLSQSSMHGHSVYDFIVPKFRPLDPTREDPFSFETTPRNLCRQGRRRTDAKLLGKRSTGEFFPIEVALVEEESSTARLLLHDASDLEIANDRLVQYQEQIERLYREMATIRENERNKIARDLHDELGQLLTICHLGIGRTLSYVADNAAKELAYVDALLLRSIDYLRQLRSGLQFPISSDLSLTSALRKMVDDISRFDSLKIDLVIGEIDELSAEVSCVAYRTIQEALTNITRHAKADAVRVEVTLDTDLLVVVSDNGRGISDPATAMRRGYGLVGIQERVEAVCGLLTIEKNLPTGTCVRAVLPTLRNAKSAATGSGLQNQMYPYRGK